MPVSNGRIYTDRSVDPPIGVSVADVQTVLGTDNCFENELCTHPNINTWAKYKPVVVAQVGPISDQQRANVNYGITNIPKWSLFANMVNFWTAYQPHRASYDDIAQWAPDCGVQRAYWDRQLPTGGNSAPFRISDFASKDYADRGYYAYAVPPIGAIDTAMVSNGRVTINYKMGYDGVTAGLTLTLSDLSVMRNYSYQNLYFGIAIKAGNNIYLVTQSTKVGNMDIEGWNLWTLGAHARFTIDEYSGGIYNCMTQYTAFDVFPVLSSVQNCFERTVGEQIVLDPVRPYTGSGTFIALYEKQSISLEIGYVYASVGMIRAWKNTSLSNRYIYYEFYLQNMDATLGHIFIWSLYVRDSFGNDIGSIASQRVSIAANGYYNGIGSVNVAQYFSGAASVYLVVEVDPDDAAPLKRTDFGFGQITG
jgi:hypothetical protein